MGLIPNLTWANAERLQHCALVWSVFWFYLWNISVKVPVKILLRPFWPFLVKIHCMWWQNGVFGGFWLISSNVWPSFVIWTLIIVYQWINQFKILTSIFTHFGQLPFLHPNNAFDHLFCNCSSEFYVSCSESSGRCWLSRGLLPDVLVTIPTHPYCWVSTKNCSWMDFSPKLW